MSACDEMIRCREQLRDVLERLVPSIHDQAVIIAAADALRKAAVHAERDRILGERQQDPQ
jgi:hypothetical protein